MHNWTKMPHIIPFIFSSPGSRDSESAGFEALNISIMAAGSLLLTSMSAPEL